MRQKMRAVSIAAACLVAAAASFVMAENILGTAGGDAQQPPPPRVVDQLSTVTAEQTFESQEPAYVGSIDGIFIAPTTAQWPSADQAANATTVAGDCSATTLSGARALAFSSDLTLPASFKSAAPPVATECGGQPSGITWEYSLTGAGGIPADIIVARSVSKALAVRTTKDHVLVETIGGREAIVVAPTTPDGLGQTSEVVFPESFGMTRVHAFNLSRDDLLVVAAAVSQATQ